MDVCLCVRVIFLCIIMAYFRNKWSFPSFICLTFSQLNEGVILYDQNKPESVGWSAADTFSFTVSLPPAFLPPHTFTFLISYQANEHHDSPQHKTRLLNNAGTTAFQTNKRLVPRGISFKDDCIYVCVYHAGAVVAEGGRVTIDRSKLDASNLLGKIPVSHRKDHHIMYRVISFPRYGILSIRGHNLARCVTSLFISH